MVTSSPRIEMVYTVSEQTLSDGYRCTQLRVNWLQVALIRGFYFGPRRPTGLIDVAVNHHAVDCGYSIPTLEPWLTAPYKIQSALYHGDCADIQYKIYFQLPGECRSSVVAAEFIIFNLSVLDQRLASVSLKEEGLYNVLEAWVKVFQSPELIIYCPLSRFLICSPKDFPTSPTVADKIIEVIENTLRQIIPLTPEVSCTLSKHSTSATANNLVSLTWKRPSITLTTDFISLCLPQYFTIPKR